MQNNVFNFELGEILMLLRKRKNLTKVDVAKFLGVTNITIDNYESNLYVPPYRRMKQLKELLGDDMDIVLDFYKNETGFKGKIII